MYCPYCEREVKVVIVYKLSSENRLYLCVRCGKYIENEE